MESSPETDKSSAPRPVGDPSRSDSHAQLNTRRRKLLGLGISSSLMLTIASRPAWANGYACSPSALASANLSGRHDFEGCGISAGWWGAAGADRWPPFVDQTSSFVGLFGQISVKVGSNFYPLYSANTDTLLSVLQNPGGGPTVNPGNIGMHAVAAYLNAVTFPRASSPWGAGYAYTPEQVLNMYAGLDGHTKSSFDVVAMNLENANNDYDNVTAKPVPSWWT